MLTQVETHSGLSSIFSPCSFRGEDADLTLQLRRNELTDLVVREKNHFLRIAVSILRDRAEAEDVVHTAFCAAWKAMGGFAETLPSRHGSQESLRTVPSWL